MGLHHVTGEEVEMIRSAADNGHLTEGREAVAFDYRGRDARGVGPAYLEGRLRIRADVRDFARFMLYLALENEALARELADSAVQDGEVFAFPAFSSYPMQAVNE